MSAKSEVPVYYLDSSADESPCRVDSRDAWRKAKREGLGFFIDHGRAFRLYEKTPIVESIFPPSGTTAPSTISLAEMRANVGITEEWERNPSHAIRCAQQKIRAYPYISDGRAPIATPFSMHMHG